MEADFEMTNGQLCHIHILEHKSRNVVRVLAEKYSPFVEYGYFNETSMVKRGCINKNKLINLTSKRIRPEMNCWHCGAEIDEGTTCEICRDDGWEYPAEWKLEERNERVSTSK